MVEIARKKGSLSVKAMAFIAMFMALQVVLEYVFNLIPGQPQGGTITLSLLPIVLASYLIGGKYGLIVGCGATVLQFALGMAKFYGPWSLFLDYLIPLTVCGAAVWFKNFKLKNYTIYTGIILTMILKFVSHYFSGAWLFAEYAPDGISPWIYSFGYNLAYCLPTLVITYVAFLIIYPRLEKSIKIK